MVKVSNLIKSLDFYCNKLGLMEVNRTENEQGRFTLIFLVAPEDSKHAEAAKGPLLELTYNWDLQTYAKGINFGNLAYSVENIYKTCQQLKEAGVGINRLLVMATWLLYVPLIIFLLTGHARYPEYPNH
jgi:lactoylglutathione lyase